MDQSVSLLLPSSSDLDIDVIARVISPTTDADPEIDAVLAQILPHPDDPIEDISTVLRNAINATLLGVNHDQDRWTSQVASTQAMTLRKSMERIDDIPSQTYLLAAVMDAALDTSLLS